jgi:fluoride exporter
MSPKESDDNIPIAMNHILWVGIGGFIGAVARFKLGGFVLQHATDWKFPVSTWVVNVSGCFVTGILTGLVVKHDLFSPGLRLFLFTGVLGGFTTFSAFGVETLYLFQRHEPVLAILNVLLSILFGLGALYLGTKLI